MLTLIQESTKNTPEVSFENEQNVFSVKGISTPMNAFEFYHGINKWIDDNINLLQDGTRFFFNLPYFNSASMKAILILLERIKKGIEDGHEWSIEWFVEDEDEFMQDAADSLQLLLNLQFMLRK